MPKKPEVTSKDWERVLNSWSAEQLVGLQLLISKTLLDKLTQEVKQ